MPCERLKAAYELAKTVTVELNREYPRKRRFLRPLVRPFSPFYGVIAAILCLSQIRSRKLRKLSETGCRGGLWSSTNLLSQIRLFSNKVLRPLNTHGSLIHIVGTIEQQRHAD